MIYTLILNECGTVLWLSHSDSLHKREQIVGQKVWDLVPSEERDAVRKLLADALIDAAEGEHIFTSKFVASRPRYRVHMTPISHTQIAVTVQRVLPQNLTYREKQVLKLIAEGVKPHDIAKRLHISTHTVDSYRRNLKDKLDAKSTAGLVAWALRTGLTAPCN